MALSAPRDTPEIRDPRLRVLGVLADAVIHAGALVVADGDGYAQPGAVATGLTAVGRAEETVDATNKNDGDLTVKVRRGVFRFKNSASTDEITAGEIGTTCYIVDDETVAKTNGSNARSAAGKVYDVDAQGVWVEIA